ncbi:PKD domain protein [compost metagenome]
MEARENLLNGFRTREVKNLESWKKFNTPEYYSHPEFGKLPDNAPCDNCVEVLEKRKIDERYFVNITDNNEFYTQKALGDLHQFVNGSWISIEHELQPASGTKFESGYLLDRAAIDFSIKRTELKTNEGTFQFNNWKLIVVQNALESNEIPANWSDYTVGSDGALIRNIFPGIDAEMVVLRGAVKTSFIIKSNEFGVFEKLLFREHLEGLNSLHAQFADGNHTQGIGSLKLMSGSTELAVMDEAKLFAKNGPKNLARSGVYNIHSNMIDVLVDYSWINENIGSYQLVVDPLVTGTATLAQASITGSRYNGSCDFTNSCDYNLVVPCPANATFTDLTFSFTYIANGTTCWLQDGAMRIATGGCVSPSAAGFYWFCNAIGGGNCSAANQTVFSDLAGCMPAAGCAAQNVTFTLQFFRSCWGATGCSNTCIGAGSPWVMNATGRTLEYTNQTTPIALSATTVCQGGSLTATTSAAFGVPGYTYNWSFNASGTPSVGTGTSASISFPTAGTITLYSIVTDACGNQITSNRTITVTPGTPPTITAGGPTTFCAGGSVVLTSSSATGNTWSNGATTQSITVTASGSYTVTVVSGSCSSTSVATVVTVNPVPATPTITASGPMAFCTGGSVTLTSSSATGNTWSNGATTQSISVSASGTYSVTVSAGGCTSAAASTTITVNPVPPTPTITAGGPTTFCTGGSVTLTSSSATGNTWSNGATTQSITVTASGTYTVTVSNGSCSATSTATTVTVNPLPATPTITAGGPTTFCAGGSVTLTSSSATGNTWSNGATTPSITVTASGNYTVTVSNGSCSTTSAATTVTVNPVPPTPTITAGGPTTFCAGGSVTLTSSSTTGNTWSNGATTQSITVTASGTFTVTVSGGTCSATSTATTVTVNPLPPVPTITAGGPTTFCAGGSVVLTSSSTTGNTWSNGATTQSITVSASGSYVVTVSNGPCSIMSAPTTVTVNPLPATPTITAGGPTTFCAGGSVVLTSSAATGNTWSNGATTQAITVTASGTFTVTVSNGTCSATSTAATVTVNPLPATPTITAGGSTTFCAGGSVVLTSSATTGNTWSNGATTQAITVTTGGTYTVTASLGACSTTSAPTTVTVTPLPTITASNNGPLCVGQTLNLTATGTGSFVWTGPNGFNSTSQNPSIASITGADFGTYTVTLTSNLCSSSATTTVTVNPGNSTAINSAGPFCENGTTVSLTSVSPGGSWSGTGIVNAASGLFDPAVAGAGSHVITYDIPGSCSGPSSTTIVVNPAPIVAFTANNISGCSPLQVTFTNTTPGAISALWNFGNGQTSTSLTTGSASFTSQGCYDIALTVTDANGCMRTSTKTGMICVNPEADASFVPSPATATVTSPEIQFINTSTNATSYTWLFGDGGTSAAFSPVHAYDQVVGNYLVKLIATNSFGCSDTSSVIVRILDELIYYVPNCFTPNGDEHNNTFQPVFTSGFDPYSFTMAIFNRWGEIIFESHDSKVGWDGTYNGTPVQEGTYSWTVTFRDSDNDKKYSSNGHLVIIK